MSKAFENWSKRADIHIMHLKNWQYRAYRKQLEKAFNAGRKYEQKKSSERESSAAKEE